MKKILKYILIGFVDLIVIGLLAGGSDKNKSSGNKKSETKTEISKPQEVQKVEICALC